MVNFKLVSKILGQLLFIESALMIWCLLLAFYYKEDDIFAFLFSFVLTILVAITLTYQGRDAQDNLTRRDAYMVVSLAWVVFSLMGAIPFMVSGYINDFTNAFFEAISGFTTTGATILDDVEKLPHGLLFWRTMSQWVGGLGIVFFTIALLPSLIGGSTRIFAAEVTGPIRTKLHPRLSTSAKWIWSIYIGMTLACMGSYILCGMNVFDAANFAMTTTATGGFSTHNSVTQSFATPAMEYVCTLFCFMAGINFSLLYFSIFNLRLKSLLKNAEFKLFISIIIIGTLVLMGQLLFVTGYDIEHAFRASIFHIVSFLSSTGLLNDDVATWPKLTWVLLGLCMFVGGCSGSTSGGFKCIRIVILFKNIQNEFRLLLHPNAVLPLKINNENIGNNKRFTLMAFLTAYITICLIAFVIIMAAGIDKTNAVTIVMGCMTNVGPSLGMGIGPEMSWSLLPAGIKWLCAALMLVGRLEIFSVLILFSKSYWKKN